MKKITTLNEDVIADSVSAFFMVCVMTGQLA
jgi:hypothetical protein